MKLVRFFIVAALLCTPYLIHSQFVFQKLYGGASDDFFEDIKQTNDGGYIIAGYTMSFGGGNADFWAVKTDVLGNIQWNRAYGSGQRERAYGVIQTSDGGYFLTGDYNVSGTYDDQMCLKLTNTGAQQWVNYYAGPYDEEAYKAIEIQGGLGYQVAGLSDSYGGQQTEASVLTLNAAGGVVSSSYYGGSGLEFAKDICRTSDGGYITTGWTTTYGAGGEDMYVIKYSILGTVQWTRTFGGAGNENGWSIRQTSDGGYIACGYTTSYGNGQEDVFVVKMTANGTLSWARAFGGGLSERGYTVRQTTDGGYVIAGKTNTYGFGNQDAYITKLDGSGNYLWSKCFGGVQEDVANVIEELNSTDLIIAGYTRSFGSGGSDGYLIKIRSNGDGGLTCPGISVPTIVQNITPAVGGGGSNKTGSQTLQYPGTLITPVLPPPCFCADYIAGGPISGITLACSPVTGTPYSIPAIAGAVNYIWTITNGTITGGQGTSAITVDLGTQNATLAVRVDFGCEVVLIDSIDIRVDIISVNISGDTVLCANDGTLLTATVNGGEPPLLLQWNNGNTTPSINVGPLVNTTTYSILVTDDLGCTASDSVVVTVHPYPIVNLGNDTIYCDFPQVTLDAGNPGSTYGWNTTATTQTISPNVSGLYWVDVDANGCVTRDSINITFGNTPTITVSGTSQVCAGQSATINSATSGGVQPYSFAWTSGQTTPNITVIPPVSGYYKVTVTDDIGCTDADSLFITVDPYPVVNIGNDTILCSALPFAIAANNAGATYSWNTGDASPGILVTQTGTYWVDVTTTNCTTRDSIYVQFDPLPSVDLGENLILCSDVTLTLDAGVADGIYTWNTGENTQQITINEPGIYWVNVNKCNINVGDTVRIAGGFSAERVYVPNAFTPNDDGVNDLFQVYYDFGGLSIQEFSLIIFDRWGNEIKEFKNAADAWSGYNAYGDSCTPDIYVYTMRLYDDCLGGEVIRRGKIALLR